MKTDFSNNITKKIYLAYGLLAAREENHDKIIHALSELFENNKTRSKIISSEILDNIQTSNQINLVSLFELIGLVHQKKKELELLSNTDERKHNGIYYTNYSIAKKLAEDTIEFYAGNFRPDKLTFLEPCAGNGIFAIAYLDTIFELDKTYIKKAQNIISNMFFADIDGEAISLLRKIIPLYIKSKYGINTEIPIENTYIGDVLFKVEENRIIKVNLLEVFNKNSGFDLVLTNPPYKLLKANSNKYNGESDNYRKYVLELVKHIRKNKIYKYNTGTLNLYKLFVEEIVENYLNSTGKVGLLIPSTLLSDKQSFDLRNRFLEKYTFATIYTIPEKNNFFLDISQAFCFFALDKSKRNSSLSLKINVKNVEDMLNQALTVSKDDISVISSLKEIVSTDKLGWKILHKVHKNRKLKEISSISNLRGELDLTLHKKYISMNVTEYRLLRGNGINEYAFGSDTLYVEKAFVNKLNGKAHYLQNERIVCQQISNINLSKRLKFSKVPNNIVLGNSCNFIVTNNDTLFTENEISLNYLLGLLNSLLLNWRFQLTSSNNHIGNYELDELPIAIGNVSQRRKIEAIVDSLLKEPNNVENKILLNKIVFELYGIEKSEALHILKTYSKDKVASLTGKYIFQT